jgi:hypothetical protein
MYICKKNVKTCVTPVTTEKNIEIKEQTCNFFFHDVLYDKTYEKKSQLNTNAYRLQSV